MIKMYKIDSWLCFSKSLQMKIACENSLWKYWNKPILLLNLWGFDFWGCRLVACLIFLTICKHLTILTTFLIFFSSFFSSFLIFFSSFFSSSSPSYSPDASVLESSDWPGRGMHALLPLPAEDGDRSMQWNVWCDDKMDGYWRASQPLMHNRPARSPKVLFRWKATKGLMVWKC